ncbi:MAG: sulfotransferase family 2 domain-containing protein [Rhodospirillales bacterium]|jgi:hypothetical protein|nr:sulfotransferase family 2 domain-containing protein [Rhodospirillales bacterium]MBT4626102.1 sulfotransferase family 2 domain-containing protein [Rhodospirillales bacterium]MBT6109361.1 sulfotransferase family 2 domain-containing protein [Rhodospirillales bacterium]MBT7777623.1 sulfotransferase family 2 domain-containing protein [Rhodospirillales bacterium]
MLGIGRLVKEVSYDAKIRFRQDSWHQLLACVAPNFHEYRRLFHLSNDIVISEERNYLYVANLKAASTSVRNRLWELGGNSPLEDPTEIWAVQDGMTFARNLPQDVVISAFQDRDWFRFSFVRNPFARLVSTYKFLVPRLPPPNGGGSKVHLNPSKYRWHPGFNNTVSFEQFIHIACTDKQYFRDQHIHRQVDLLHIPAISYEFIGKIENLTHDLSFVLRKLNAPSWVVERAAIVDNKTRADDRLSDWFTTELAEKVRIHYAEDFRTFDYPYSLPD